MAQTKENPMASGPSKAEVKAVAGVFTDYIDFRGQNASDLRQSLNVAINTRRAGMTQFDSVGCIIIKGGDERLREINAQLLKIACEASMFRLLNDDPHSFTAEWSREHDGATPYMFRQTPPLQVPGKNGQMLSRPGLAICVNGTSSGLRSEVFDELIAELGLTLTTIDQRSIYPRGWDGRQAMTAQTAAKG